MRSHGIRELSCSAVPHGRNRGGRGFALIVTMMLMVLLIVLAIGMLSLSSVSQRTNTQGKILVAARANARLSMMLALGELQRHAGPDQRVTANASQWEWDHRGLVPQTVVNRQWSGVWRTDGLRTETTSPPNPIINRSASLSGTDAGSLKDRREDGTTYNRTREVLTWLVSNPRPATRLNPVSGLAASMNPVRLVGAGSVVASAVDQVWAPKVSFKQGAYAWWVGDESCKARFDLADAPEGASAASPAWHNPAQSGIGTMAGLEKYETLADDVLAKTITPSTADLALPPQAGKASALRPHFHNLSFHSAGVLADTQNGGLRRDLSAFLATGKLAASGTLPEINTDSPILNSPMLNLISAKFGMLKTWNDLAAKVDSSGEIDVVPPTSVADGIA